MRTTMDEDPTLVDERVAQNPLLRQIRAQNLERLKQVFPPGAWVLELGCGTGDEALMLAAQGCTVWGIDRSHACIAQASAKAQARGLQGRAHFRVLDLNAVGLLEGEIPAERLTGAWSSLGALNLLAELAPVRDGLARLLKPSGRLVLQVFNDNSAFEKLFALTHAAFSMANRRRMPGQGLELLAAGSSTREVEPATTVQTHFRAPQALADAFKPHFSVDKVLAVNPLQPSVFLHERYARHSGLYDQLGKLTRLVAEAPSVVRASDLYVLMMFRETLELGGHPHGPHWLANG